MNDGRIIKGLETKQKIISATLEMISEEGIKSLSAQKIAQKAGVSKSNIFHHFGSVDILPFEGLKYLTELLLSSLDPDNYQSTEELLICIGQETLTNNQEYLKMFRAFFALYNESFYDERYKNVMNHMKNLYKNSLFHTIMTLEKDLDETKLMSLAKMITIVIDGFGYHFMTDEEPEIFMDLWRIQVDLILNQIEKIRK